MTLDPSALTDALADAFGGEPATAAAAADNLAAAYFDYASGAQFVPCLPTLLPLQQTTMAATLLGAIATPASGTPATFATAWATAVGAFWVGVAVAGGGQAGTTPGCPGAAALTGTLTTLFANTNNSLATTASGLSSALSTATLTVTATVSPPPGTVLPIT
jgi:hypothetical protein